MSFPNTSKKSAVPPEAAAPPRVRREGNLSLFSLGPRPLRRLAPGQCRFCIVDAPRGQMDQALFCGALAQFGPYCDTHRRRCLAPPQDDPADIDALVAEIEAALQADD